MPNPVVRPPDIIREAWRLRFGIAPDKAKKWTISMLPQLSFCKSDEARRLILGISHKSPPPK